MMAKYMNMNVADLKIMEDQIVATDQISELPDFIIHHIMSYPSTQEATQTCVLSKRWNHLQTSFLILDFDLIYFEEKDSTTSSYNLLMLPYYGFVRLRFLCRNLGYPWKSLMLKELLLFLTSG